MGRKRGLGNSTPQKTYNSIQVVIGKEENVYPVPDPNTRMQIITNEPNDVHKKNLSKRKL
jgi:hypothetical protein